MAKRHAMLGLLALLALLLIARATARAAADDAPIGTVFHDVMPLVGRQIPLPAGEWTLVGRSFEGVPALDSDAYGAIESVVLFKIEDGTVAAFIIADRNLIPVEEGWGTASECLSMSPSGDDIDLPVIVTYDAVAAHNFCGFVGKFDTTARLGTTGSWKAAADYAAQNGLALPKHWLMAGLRLSNAHDVVEVRYNFAAALAGGDDPPAAGSKPPAPPAAGSSLTGWLPGWLGGGAETATIDPTEAALGDWLDRMHDAVGLGFVNGLSDTAPMPMPWTPEVAAQAPAWHLRLARLEQLRGAGTIDDKQFAVQRQLILSEEPHIVEAGISTGNLSLIKALADQATAAVPTFLGNYVVLGTFTSAGALLGIQTAVDFVHDYSIELAWNLWGPQRLREEPTIDFVGAGEIPSGGND
jgi:hypothetical protein